MTTVKFWKQTAERAVKTFAQSLGAMWGADAFNILNVDWSGSLGVALGATVLSVLSSLVSAPAGADDSPSLVDSE